MIFRIWRAPFERANAHGKSCFSANVCRRLATVLGGARDLQTLSKGLELCLLSIHRIPIFPSLLVKAWGRGTQREVSRIWQKAYPLAMSARRMGSRHAPETLVGWSCGPRKPRQDQGSVIWSVVPSWLGANLLRWFYSLRMEKSPSWGGASSRYKPPSNWCLAITPR